MPEVEITRKQIIIADEVGTNSYGDLTWTDKEGKSYKVKSTRKQYFEAIVPGQAVEISFSKYRNTEYPYSAEAVQDKIQVVEPTHLEKTGGLSIPDKLNTMTKNDWSEKDRITRKSIERQKSLEMAVEMAKIKGVDTAVKVITTAKIFETYLAGGETKSLLDAAKELGAKEVEP